MLFIEECLLEMIVYFQQLTIYTPMQQRSKKKKPKRGNRSRKQENLAASQRWNGHVSLTAKPYIPVSD
jgi:hypothetical protein